MGRAGDGGDFFNYRVLHQVVCFQFSVKKAGAGASPAQQNNGSAGFQPVPFRVRTAHRLKHVARAGKRSASRLSYSGDRPVYGREACAGANPRVTPTGARGPGAFEC